MCFNSTSYSFHKTDWSIVSTHTNIFTKFIGMKQIDQGIIVGPLYCLRNNKDMDDDDDDDEYD